MYKKKPDDFLGMDPEKKGVKTKLSIREQIY